QIDQGTALGSDGDAFDRPARQAELAPELLAGAAQTLPVILWMLLGPAGLIGEIRLYRLLTLADQCAFQVEQQGAHALGAVIDSEQIRSARHGPSSSLAGGP